jgi:AcrR family transcriptional regulator
LTSHRSRTDRVSQILDAAAGIIDEQGTGALTMDAVAQRTGLSKGSVYRYFASREWLALALFEATLRAEIDYPAEAVFAWGAPLLDSLLRMMLHEHHSLGQQRLHRVFLQLLPEALVKPAFRAVKERLEDEYVERYRGLVLELFARDGLAPTPGFEARLTLSLRLAATLMEGMTYRMIGGAPREELEAQCRRFLEVMLRDALEVP